MLARLQRSLVYALLGGLGLWFVYAWGRGPFVILAGLLVAVLGYVAVLTLEFMLAYRLNRDDPAPPAGLALWLRAWLTEMLTAPRVFLWQQPFRSQAVPDGLTPAAVQGRRGIVFIHGFVCNRGYWNPWLRQLRRSGHPFAALSLEPVFGSIEDYVSAIEAAVQRVSAATGQPPLLVCHSMGGLAARAWLRAHQADARVHHVITIGTPHHGTWLARYSPAINGRQMTLHSAWLRQLAQDEPPQRRRLFTCYHSNCDNIVFPAALATLAGADNRLVSGVPHVALGAEPRIMREVLARAGVAGA
jgi:pimeloyl-ACP methyl ester carboxylesterase